ncbi:MAG: hypothetical protein WDM71_04645 [Ferruginibacter sp.]
MTYQIIEKEEVSIPKPEQPLATPSPIIIQPPVINSKPIIEEVLPEIELEIKSVPDKKETDGASADNFICCKK